MKLYRFLTAVDDATFCHKVTAALNKGWELHGSPAYTWNQETRMLMCGQAVVKEVEGKDYTPDTKLSEH